ncbi:unnamed protein product [Microthlaspi erraticum]|uniref:Uncharacterized protein n=1 Tax=Microthlaspi erraticum TaxID=1685480 RepID=A0A6D2K3X8_9BRAS|nr:unnamed protein product [Microthlaspi erraticum]
MSRKGVITKRVKTVQTALSRISAQPRSPAGRETMFRARPNHIRPTEVSAKVPNRPADHATRPGKHCPAVGQASTLHAHDRARAGETRPRGRATRSRTTADASVRAGKERPTSGRETIGQISSARPRRPTVNPSDPDRSDSPRPDCPADRPARPSQRRGRPEALFEAQTYVFKPGLTLAASRKT